MSSSFFPFLFEKSSNVVYCREIFFLPAKYILISMTCIIRVLFPTNAWYNVDSLKYRVFSVNIGKSRLLCIGIALCYNICLSWTVTDKHKTELVTVGKKTIFLEVLPGWSIGSVLENISLHPVWPYNKFCFWYSDTVT